MTKHVDTVTAKVLSSLETKKWAVPALTDDQKEQIHRLVKAGDVLGAQKLILQIQNQP